LPLVASRKTSFKALARVGMRRDLWRFEKSRRTSIGSCFVLSFSVFRALHGVHWFDILPVRWIDYRGRRGRKVDTSTGIARVELLSASLFVEYSTVDHGGLVTDAESRVYPIRTCFSVAPKGSLASADLVTIVAQYLYNHQTDLPSLPFVSRMMYSVMYKSSPGCVPTNCVPELCDGIFQR